MGIVTLTASGGESFEIDIEIAKQSETIKVLLEDLLYTGKSEEEGAGDKDEDPIPLPNVSADILKMVLDWCTHHKDDPPLPEKPVVEENPSRPNIEISPWDKAFLNLEQSVLFPLILAADYLNVKGLLDVCTKKLTSMMVAKTPEEVRELFNIKNDFTPEEEQKIKEQNSWCEI